MRLRSFALVLGAFCMSSTESFNMQGRKESVREREWRIRRAKERKQPLTPKQKKARAKSKRASKRRNELRSHPNYKMQLKNERKSRSIK